MFYSDDRNGKMVYHSVKRKTGKHIHQSLINELPVDLSAESLNSQIMICFPSAKLKFGLVH